MDPRVQEILDNASDIQQEYVIARLTCTDSAKACRKIGISRSSPCHWPNREELEEAVQLLRRDAVEAARLALRDLAVEAVRTLARAMNGKGGAAVNAAKEVLDRTMGKVEQSHRVKGIGEGGAIVLTWGDDNARPIAGPAPRSSDSQE